MDNTSKILNMYHVYDIYDDVFVDDDDDDDDVVGYGSSCYDDSDNDDEDDRYFIYEVDSIAVVYM